MECLFSYKRSLTKYLSITKKKNSNSTVLKPTKHYLKQVGNIKINHNKTHGHHVPRMKVNEHTYEFYVIFAKNAKS